MSGSAYALEGLSPYAYGGVPQMAPQGFFGNALGALAGPLGGLLAGPAGGVVGGMLGRHLGPMIPFAAPGPQLAPQGAIGDMIGAVGNPLAQHLGALLHQQQLGQAIGNLLATAGPMLPFAAGPQAGQVSPELDPMGFNLGRLIRGAQQAVQTAQQAMNAVNTVRQFLPFAAEPGGFDQQGQQFAPQGVVGNLLGQYGGHLGGALGGLFGHQQLGNQLGGIAAQLGPMLPFGAQPMSTLPPELDPLGFSLGGLIRGAQRAVQSAGQVARTAGQVLNTVNTVRQFLPFAAEPGGFDQQGQQFAPQGVVGNLLGQYGGHLGGALGGLFGHQQLGNQLGGIAAQLGPMLPFGAQPMSTLPPELDPLGFSLGGLIRGAQRAVQTAGQAARTAGQVLNTVNTVRQFLPFAAEPGAGGLDGYGAQQAQQFAPQGVVGNLLGQYGGQLGGALGGLFGQQQLGNQLGGIAAQLGPMLPFGAQPMAAGQGAIGNLLGGAGGLYGQYGGCGTFPHHGTQYGAWPWLRTGAQTPNLPF